ncbi:hypothetical protein [Picosynechococcus sp. NKBG15041c]|uniref:hypothetical protein n=1 Tax=Picosynechococcus sp. NKBG15041c TaxID=1407650 RepID=UPI000423C42B|nr:hypothetical protein [Picosynechococcus sp. NKBG15041c]
MATCDCEGSDRAYLIVNPSSLDRREILSLNPPICHDTKTKALLINGQLQTFSKEILSTSLSGGSSGGGVRVDWGGGDVDILPGETWGRQTNTSNQTIATGGLSYNLKLQLSSCQSGSNVVDLSVVNQAALDSSGFVNSTGTMTINPGYKVSGGGSNPFSLTGPGTITCQRFHKHNCEWGRISLNGGAFRNAGSATVSGSVTTKTITTNTGASSSRNTNIDPDVSLLPDPCVLTIAFTDNTTKEIEYGETCPDVSPIQCLEVTDQGGVLADICPYKGEPIAFSCDERKCPPETCCELDCEGGRVCCYGPDSGAAIDSFIRRT